jgi:hypothetical protein
LHVNVLAVSALHVAQTPWHLITPVVENVWPGAVIVNPSE